MKGRKTGVLNVRHQPKTPLPSLTARQVKASAASAEGDSGAIEALEWQSQQRKSWVSRKSKDAGTSKNMNMQHGWAVSLRGAILALALVAIACTGHNVFAQTGRASITGVISDSSGAVVDGVSVTATNTATGVAVATKTNSAGSFSLLQLIPGTYSIHVEKEGFSSQVQDNFLLVAEQNAGANFALRPGQVSERINVEANSELIHTESAEISQTINEHAIVELPLNGRNPAELVLLTPGTTDVVRSVGAGNKQGYTTFPTESGASTNGGRQGSTLYLLDGAYNMDNYHLLAAPFPNPDATQEFTVIGNNFDPRYGFTPGGVVSIVTKSGTNNWHGDLFEFLRNGAVNATDHFTQTSDQLKRNQFGASLGGPIVKNKLFVFGNYQGTRERRQVNSSSTYVPTTAMRSGDFSAYCQSGFNGAGLCQDTNPNPDNPGDPFVNNQIWIADPAGNSGFSHTVSQANGNPGLFYANNFVDPSTFDPASVSLVNLMPTETDDALGHIQSLGYGNIQNFWETTFRGDYNPNDHHRISGRAFLNAFNQPAYSNTFLSSDRSWYAKWKNFSGTWTWTISPSTVNNFTMSYSGLHDVSNSGLKVNGQPICYSQIINVSDPSTTPCSIEGLTINGGYGSGGIGVPAQNFNGIDRSTWGFSDSISISKGRHLFVAGVDVLRQYWYENTDWLALPIIGFGGGPGGQFTGSGFADFLLGDAANYLQGGGESNEIHAFMVAPYVADQIKLKPNLTVSLGVRYEPWIAPVTSSGRIATFLPGVQSTRYPNAPLGMVFPGDQGVPSAGTSSDYKKFFDPRVGIAWQPTALKNTSIRAAFGIYASPIDYSSWNHAGDTQPFSPTFNFNTGNIVNGSAVPIIPFSNPWSVYQPTGGVSPFPPFASPGSAPDSSAAFVTPVDIGSGFQTNFTAGRTYTWNLSIEHQFGDNWVARAAYVASESDHQVVARDNNYGQFFGAGDPLNGTRLNPNFSEILLDESTGTSNYQSGQFTLEKRFSHGLQFSANYTYSHTIDDAAYGSTAFTSGLYDPRCLECNRSTSFLSVPQVFVANFIYETPKLAGSNGATKAVLGGWQLSGIYRAQAGQPFTIVSGQTTTWDARGQDYPDYANDDHTIHINSGSAQYLDASDFKGAAQGTDGNIGRTAPGVYGPGVNSWDLGMSKKFQFRERFGFQFRWEMFNAFNRTSLGLQSLDTNWSSGSFGRITATAPAYPARIMQAALKITF
jgi:hypothetical protein